MESQIDKQEYTASAQSRARDGTGGINQPSDVCGYTTTGGSGGKRVEGCCMTSHVNKNALRFCLVYSQTLTHYLQQHVNRVVLD